MMYRPYILAVVIILVASLFSPVFCQDVPPEKIVEGRGIWLDASSMPTDDDAMSAYIEALDKANFNVLMPEVIRRGFTTYPSKLDEQDPRFKGYDPLAAIIREAHKRGMEVHPWVWVFRQGYTNNEGPIFTAHPEWMAVNKWGEKLSANGGYWVCPSNESARDYLISLIKELVSNYDVDGLHLDYVRFENQFPTPYCYDQSCRNKFKAEHGIDPIEIDPLSEMQVTWHLWREDLINTFVKRVSKEVHALKPDIKISAAVASMPEQARSSMMQDWPHWVDNKWIDFLTPMSYSANNETFKKMIDLESEAVGDRTILMPGIGLHTHKTPDQTLEQIDYSRQAKMQGVTLFASVYLKEPWQDALATGPFSSKAEIPFRNPADRVAELLDAALKAVETNPKIASSYLKDAGSLLGYLAYQAADVGYVKPTRPPIFIPPVVLPMPEAVVHRTNTMPTIDGRLDETMWASAESIRILHTNMGESAPVVTDVKLAYDDTNIYIAYIAEEPKASEIKRTTDKRDGPTFYDDSAEIFLDPWNKRREYYQLAVNTIGTQFDAKVNNASVNLQWLSAGTVSEDGWIIEIAIPFSSLGVFTPQSGDTWNVNFARNRWVEAEVQYLAWSVPYGGFHRPERFAVITFK
ncbi:MAG TPA: family 10 glycosylhydrolase [Armatimonadota bacterium]|nr:family 10 glycosylhydrolase [Armatimonadota bacterium]